MSKVVKVKIVSVSSNDLRIVPKDREVCSGMCLFENQYCQHCGGATIDFQNGSTVSCNRLGAIKVPESFGFPPTPPPKSPVNRAPKLMTFTEALVHLKAGGTVARQGWNGKGMWLCLIKAGNAMYRGYEMQDCIGMRTADRKMQPGWLASQADLLANDWVVVRNPM